MPVAELSPDPGQSGDAVGMARDEAITKPQSPLLMTTVNVDAATIRYETKLSFHVTLSS